MAFSKTLKRDEIRSGHTLFVQQIERDQLPTNLERTEHFNKFYVVKNFDAGGVVFVYLGTGHVDAPKQIVAWYRNTGKMWSSYGTTIVSAINGAQQDGWMYA